MFNFSTKFQDFQDKKKGKIRQLFRATDFQTLMYPCFSFCRILGIFPYKINASTIKICKPSYILSTIIFCVYCVFQLINLYDVNITKNYNLFKSVPRVLQINCCFFFGSVITVTTFILSRQRMRLFQTIQELSLRLPQKSYKNLSKWIHVKDIFGFFFLITQALVFFTRMQYSVLFMIFVLYVLLLAFQMDMSFMNCVCVLKACFKQINDNLANMQELVVHDEPYLVRETFHEQRLSFLLMRLKALKKQHFAINDTVKILNMNFGLQLLSTIIIAFINITIHLFFFLLRMQENAPVDNQSVFYGNFITFVTYYTVKIMLIVWACESGKNQAMEINTTVHDVLNNTNNEQIKYELRLFSLQLMHCKNIFSAKGLIVDNEFLSAMVGNITMYLSILLQFLIMSNSCEKPKINFTDKI